MSGLAEPKSPLEVVEILSDDEEGHTYRNSGGRRQSAIEIISDVSDIEASDNDLEIVSEVVNADRSRNLGASDPPGSANGLFVPEDESDIADDGEVEITGHNHIPLPTLEFLISEAFHDIGDEAQSRATPVVVQTPPPRRRQRPNPSTFLRNLRRRHNNAREAAQPQFQFGYPRGGYGYAFHANMPFFSQPDQGVTANVMEAIRRSEEREMDQKREKEDKINLKTLEKKKEAVSNISEGYTSTISATDDFVCELCAVVLGEGIPADFKPDPKFDDNIDEHAAKLRTNAPWFCIRQCFEADFELLRRVFAAKCGHVFCGRCIKNIGSRPTLKGRKKKEQASILDPRVSAPRKCPVKNCGANFMGKKTFTELYL